MAKINEPVLADNYGETERAVEQLQTMARAIEAEVLPQGYSRIKSVSMRFTNDGAFVSVTSTRSAFLSTRPRRD